MVAAADLNFDLRQLPLRAMLAYASRCARRVQPLFKLSVNHRDAVACRKAIDSAIRLAEAFAAGGQIDQQVVAQIEEITMQALLAVSADGGSDKAAAYAANAAYAVISATTAALESEFVEDPTELAERVLESCVTATESAISADDAVERASRLDWEMLHRMRLGKFPDMGEDVNPSEGGILGPLYCSKMKTHRSHIPDGTVRVHDDASAGSRTDDDGSNRRQGSGTNVASADQFDRPVNPQPDSADTRRINERILQKSKAVAARLRARRERLAQLTAAVDVERANVENERQALDAARAALAEQDRLAQEQRASFEAEAAARLEELAARELAVDQRQNELEAMARQLDKRSLELAALQQRFDDDRLELERQREELAARGQEFDVTTSQLEVRRNELNNEASRLASRVEKLKRIAGRVNTRRARATVDRLEIGNERNCLLAEIARHQESLNQQQQAGDSFADQLEQIEQQRRELETARAELDITKSKLDSDQSSLEQVHEQLVLERARLESLKTQLDAEQTGFKTDRTKVDEERELLAMQHADLEAEAKRIEGERAELQRLREAYETEHIAFLEEKEAAENKTPAAVDGPNQSVQTVPHGKPPAEFVADKSQDELKSLLAELKQERSEIHAERLHLTGLIAQLNEVRPQRRDASSDESEAGTSTRFHPEMFSLTFLLELGTAKPSQLAELLALLSNFYRVMGGEGLLFEARECRIWSYGESRAPSKKKAASERIFAEVLARADCSRDSEPDPGVWERFTSALVTIVRFDTRLTDYFNLSEEIGANDRLAAPVYKGIAQVPSAGDGDITQKSGKWSLSIDAITLQRKRIETLRSKLERDSHMTLELVGAGAGVNLIHHRSTAPAPGSDAKSSTLQEPAKKKRRGRKLLAIGSLIAVLAVILGICVL